MADDSGFTLAVFQQHVNFQQAINIVAKEADINGLNNRDSASTHDVKESSRILFHLVAFILWYTLTQIESCSGCMVEVHVSTFDTGTVVLRSMMGEKMHSTRPVG